MSAAEKHNVQVEALAAELLHDLRSHANPVNVEGMQRYGISPVGTLGVTMPIVRGLASEAKRRLGRDTGARHLLATLLWESGVHEARIMAAVLEVPALATREQAEDWALELDSWDTCDQLCGNLLWRTSFGWELPIEWSCRPQTFVKRAGFVMITQLCKDKKASDERFLPLLSLCEREAGDPRNDVKKAVNWAIRAVGKRSAALNAPAIECAERILATALATEPPTDASRAARWIARDALRELRSDAVRSRLMLA